MHWLLQNGLTDEAARAYAAASSYADACVGLILDALKHSRYNRNTIVVLWSDHGWKLGEFNGWGKMTNYEIDTRVPLVIAAPGLKTAGQHTDEWAGLIDLFPTLCDLAGIAKPDFVDGTSLLPTLTDTTVQTNQAAYSQGVAY